MHFLEIHILFFDFLGLESNSQGVQRLKEYTKSNQVNAI